MLFIYLLDEDEEMRTASFSGDNSAFAATYFDASLYFIEYYSKNVYGGSSRVVDESATQKSKAGDHHRTIFFTFTGQKGGHLDLKSTWKDSQNGHFEAIKNVSFEARKGKGKIPAEEDASAIANIGDKFEDFMEKFSTCYFACTNRNNGYFIWNEPESIMVFVLSSSRSRLDALQSRFKNGWQRKNIFIHVNAVEFEGLHDPLCAGPRQYYPFYPLATLRASHQLGQALYRATSWDSFELNGMEMLSKGSWSEFVSANDGTAGLGLLKSRFSGHSKWPVPIPLTEDDCDTPVPKLFFQSGKPFSLPELEFDEYVTYSPLLSYAVNSAPNQLLYLFVQSQTFGPCLIGYIKGFPEALQGENSKPLVSVFIGPMAFDRLAEVFSGKLDVLAYLRSVPNFYEHFIRASIGEPKWAKLCGGTAKNFQKSDFTLPRAFSERKNALRSSIRHRMKADLVALVERAEASNRLISAKRSVEFSARLIPPLERLQGDAPYMSRLLYRFQLAKKVFETSCRDDVKNSESTLSSILFKHCLPTQQMTDYAEAVRKKRPLRPLFTEHERDLFLILKENPFLAEEMSSAQFVSGDIFGNPFKRDRRDRKQKVALVEHEEVVDEIDVREMEDMEMEIVIEGQVVNLPTIQESLSDERISEPEVDLYIVEDLIRSPGGAMARQELAKALQFINDGALLKKLLALSQRYKRRQLEPLIQTRLESVIK